MFSIIWKFLMRFLVIFTFLLGIFSPMLTPLSQVAIWGITWERIIILICLISAMIIYIQTEIENRKRPNIKIIPVIANRSAILEIHNKGGVAKFRATTKIIKNNHEHLNEIYTLYWEPQGETAEIGKNGIGKILIAKQETMIFEHPQLPSLIGLKMIITTEKNEQSYFNAGIWPIGDMKQIIINQPPDDIYLEISISADKYLSDKFKRLVFRISQNTITSFNFELINKKRRKQLILNE